MLIHKDGALFLNKFKARAISLIIFFFYFKTQSGNPLTSYYKLTKFQDFSSYSLLVIESGAITL